ncbi:hypothetical protein HAX54_011592 [Datura stramonium]|uniref:RING-type E3 ubiquitin transferase n=1 Tax=Datura stramonium TaxID=4076 RepID=A0ABS8TK91_DATST|nr:hypothetical protein [Datura stramonium]
MDNFLVFFVSFLLFSSVYARDDCPLDSICGNNRFDIRFPFGLEDPHIPQHCSYNPDFNLKCNNQGRAILSLPGAGDFYAVFYRNYTFLTCSTDLVTSRFSVIGCMSNSATSTLVTSSTSLASQMKTHGMNRIAKICEAKEIFVGLRMQLLEKFNALTFLEQALQKVYKFSFIIALILSDTRPGMFNGSDMLHLL